MNPVIPTPRHVARGTGSHALAADAATQIVDWAADGADPAHAPGAVRLASAADVETEGYRLDIDDAITLRAASPAGFHHGAQTLRQLLTPALDAGALPALRVKDAPRLSWRGLHVDVARHWFPVEALKRLVDTMALHKFNRLHWHLTDDQGWRLEIRSWPRLTEVGAWRAESPRRGARTEGDGKRYGGFYTQAQVRDLVAYANRRGITVVPEIDMPGHVQAAIAAYPEFGHGDAPEVWTRWGISKRILNVTDETLAFLEDVIEEVTGLFPGPYVHLGGDEMPTAEWEASPVAQARMKEEGIASERQLQGWFLRRMAAALARRDKRVIGWDEVLECGAPEDAIVMAWRALSHARTAAARGHDVVLCPQHLCYFDHYQGPEDEEPEAIGGFSDVDKVLGFDPLAGWPDDERTRLLGIQGNLWSEYIHDEDHLMYMAWPRASALADVAWTGGAVDPASFRARWPAMAARLRGLGVPFRA